MTFRSSLLGLSALSLTAIAACSSATSTPDAARAPDAFTATLDALTETPDAPSNDDDAGSDAPLAVDAGADAFIRPADAAPLGDVGFDCAYASIDDVIVKCGERYRSLQHFRSDPTGACPDFYGFTATGPHYATPAEAIAADATCNGRCIYDFSNSFSRLWCGRRTGYESLSAEGCSDIFLFAEGYYDSVEAHDAMIPCPE